LACTKIQATITKQLLTRNEVIVVEIYHHLSSSFHSCSESFLTWNLIESDSKKFEEELLPEAFGLPLLVCAPTQEKQFQFENQDTLRQ